MISNIILLFIWPIIIIGLIVFFAWRRNKGGRLPTVHPSADKEWYLRLAMSKEDAVGQLFLLLSFLFLGVTLFSFNKDFGDPFAWRTIVLMLSLIGLVGAYYLKTVYILFLSLLGSIIWWVDQVGEWTNDKNTVSSPALFTGLSFVALLLYSLGRLHEKEIRFKRFALVYLVLGLVWVTGTLFFFSTNTGIVYLGELTREGSFLGSWQITLSLVVFLVSLVGATLWAMAQKLIYPLESIVVFGLTGLFGITALLPEQIMFLKTENTSRELSNTGIFWALFYNIAIFLELLWLIFSGYVRRETWLINMGAIFLFLLVAVKYFDWFFSFLDKSIFFISAGVLFFVVGWFMERGRRYMISNLKTQTQQIPQK